MSDLRALAHRLGGEVAGRGVSCPGPGHSPQDRSLRVFPDDAAPLRFRVHSHAGDDWETCQDHVADILGVDRWRPGIASAPANYAPSRSSVQSDVADFAKTQKARAIWNLGVLIAGTHVETYLRSRGIDCDKNQSIRCIPDYGVCGNVWPCMVVAVAAPDRNITSVQITALAPDGSGKAPVLRARDNVGPLRDGAVRLAPATDELGIAEGVETALSAMQLTGVPTWSCQGAARMHLVAIPASVKRLHIFGDNDDAGRTALERTLAAHQSIDRVIRDVPGGLGDWNDALRARAET